MASEFGARIELLASRFRVARRTDEASAPALRAMQGVAVYARTDGMLYALFESTFWQERVQAEQPELTLAPTLQE
ncbi:MAG: hypothetical protein AB7L13_24795 [Acidimicrobiia bacterium]